MTNLTCRTTNTDYNFFIIIQRKVEFEQETYNTRIVGTMLCAIFANNNVINAIIINIPQSPIDTID